MRCIRKFPLPFAGEGKGEGIRSTLTSVLSLQRRARKDARSPCERDELLTKPKQS
jgi:hypothetical protein